VHYIPDWNVGKVEHRHDFLPKVYRIAQQP